MSTPIPPVAEMTRVDGYAECQEILVAPRSFFTGVFHERSAPAWDGIMAVSNGESHLARRRLAGGLFAPAAMGKAIDAVFDRALDEWLDSCRGARARRDAIPNDLIRFVRLATIRMQAIVVGLGGVSESNDDAARILQLAERWAAATQTRWSTRTPEEIDEVIRVGQEARDAFGTEFFWPAVRAHEPLVAAHAAGTLAFDELPDDLITRQLLPAGREVWSAENALVDAFALINGGIGTMSASIANALELYNPSPARDRSREADPVFVRNVANEVLRLRPPVTVILRQAVADAILSTGRRFQEREFIALDVMQANRDPVVFGEDAQQFDPDRHERPRPGVPAFGLAFGGGPHLCIGRPLVTASGSSQETSVLRSMTRILLACFAFGIEPDPAAQASRAQTTMAPFERYPVVIHDL